jgi:hypothetical protein
MIVDAAFASGQVFSHTRLLFFPLHCRSLGDGFLAPSSTRCLGLHFPAHVAWVCKPWDPWKKASIN